MPFVKELFVPSVLALVLGTAGCWRSVAATLPDAAPPRSAAPIPSGSCNTLDQLGSAVAGGKSSSPVPPMSGGIIFDGTYVLVSNLAYERRTPDERTHKRTLKFLGDTVEVVDSDNGGHDVRASYKFTTTRNQIIHTATCPQGLPGVALAYSATTTSFISVKAGDERLVETYVRQ